MAWTPGNAIETPEHEREWQTWLKQRRLASQRVRRQQNRRIDYYPSPEAAAVIDSLTNRYAGGDYSSIINRMILESQNER